MSSPIYISSSSNNQASFPEFKYAFLVYARPEGEFQIRHNLTVNLKRVLLLLIREAR